MLFNSISYLIFFPSVLLLYWNSPSKLKKPLLLVASYVFYMSWLPIYGLLILALTVLNFALGISIARFSKRSKVIFVSGLVLNLGTLCYFKYAAFITGNFDWLLGLTKSWTGISFCGNDPITCNIILPLGISFFSFEFIHYLSDVYKGTSPVRKFLDFAVFAAFFPSQIAGPIKRYQHFTKQLAAARPFNSAQAQEGVALILQGLFKKVAVADNLSPIVSAAFADAARLGALDAWLAAVCFALQIYFDFSGYTDMGRGSAKMLGFDLPDNFNLPYIACNLSDFWKRWHITLSTWLRDYLYIPLGGGRCSRLRKHANLMITMLLGGLWHGAAWHFVVWGGLHGAGLVASHEYESFLNHDSRLSLRLRAFHSRWIGRVTSIAITFLFVLVGWICFRASSMNEALLVFSRLFSAFPSELVLGLLSRSPVVVALMVYSIYALGARFGRQLTETWPSVARVMQLQMPARVVVYCGAFIAAVGFAPQTVSPFIYFQF